MVHTRAQLAAVREPDPALLQREVLQLREELEHANQQLHYASRCYDLARGTCEMNERTIHTLTEALGMTEEAERERDEEATFYRSASARHEDLLKQTVVQYDDLKEQYDRLVGINSRQESVLTRTNLQYMELQGQYDKMALLNAQLQQVVASAQEEMEKKDRRIEELESALREARARADQLKYNLDRSEANAGLAEQNTASETASLHETYAMQLRVKERELDNMRLRLEQFQATVPPPVPIPSAPEPGRQVCFIYGVKDGESHNRHLIDPTDADVARVVSEMCAGREEWATNAAIERAVNARRASSTQDGTTVMVCVFQDLWCNFYGVVLPAGA